MGDCALLVPLPPPFAIFEACTLLEKNNYSKLLYPHALPTHSNQLGIEDAVGKIADALNINTAFLCPDSLHSVLPRYLCSIPGIRY